MKVKQFSFEALLESRGASRNFEKRERKTINNNNNNNNKTTIDKAQ